MLGRLVTRMRLIAAFAAFLTGCSKPAPEPLPDKAGTSAALAYPAVLIEPDAPSIRFYDSEEPLITTRMSSGVTFAQSRVIDSGGGLYTVVGAIPVGKVVSAWRDMGTTPYRIFLRMRREKTIDLGQARALILEQVRNPRSSWSYSAETLRNSVARVESFRNLAELVKGCETSWEWDRER